MISSHAVFSIIGNNSNRDGHWGFLFAVMRCFTTPTPLPLVIVLQHALKRVAFRLPCAYRAY